MSPTQVKARLESVQPKVIPVTPVVTPADDATTSPQPQASRNLSVNAYFRATAERHVPRYRFAGQDFAQWQAELLPAVRKTLGRMPDRVPLNAQVQAEWREHGLVKQRVEIGRAHV